MAISKIALVLICILGMTYIAESQNYENEQITKEEVLQVMQKFQDGYIKRDSTIIDDFVKLFTDDVVCMGVASHEFFKGQEKLRNLTLWDWKKWFDLRIPLNKIDIRIENDVAWFAVIGSSGPWRDNKTYQIRMFGSLIKTDGKVQFKQICYSYPAPLKVIDS